MDCYILGISSFYHDSAAALVKNGDIIAAAQEERFTRKKHDSGFPLNAIKYCLEEGGIKDDELSYVVFYEKPFLKFERILLTYITYAPLGFKSFYKCIPLWLKEKLWIKEIIKDSLKGFKGKILFTGHHESHAASCFYPSPFKEAAVLTMDGVGEWATTSFGSGTGNKIKLEKEIRFPHSLGLLYSAFTYYAGFKVNSGDYKLMGLAPYGRPKYVNLIMDELMDLKEDGSFKLNMKYFNYCSGLTMTNKRFNRLFGGPPRRPESEITEKEKDLACSAQTVIEEAIIRMARYVQKRTGMENLCLAGGVALNCVANGRLLKEGPFKDIWVQPAAGDAGGAIGAALMAWYGYLGNKRELPERRDRQQGSFLGPAYGDDYIEDFLKSREAVYEKLDKKELVKKTAQLISGGKIVGWFQGRMEFGPRALGARSILGDPRRADMRDIINLKVKFREPFRPFAPSVLQEKSQEYFDIRRDSPYMMFVSPVKNGLPEKWPGEKTARCKIPAVTHVDSSARVQTVSADTPNRIFYDLLKEFYNQTGCPVILNTSFNVRGEPIVYSPEDAYDCFMRTEIDYLVMGSFLLDKKEQLKRMHRTKPYFEPD